MNPEKYEIEREARRPVYQKLIDILIADPLGWEMMCQKVRGPTFDPSLPNAEDPTPENECGIYVYDRDPLFDDATALAQKTKRGRFSVHLIRTKFGISYGRASALMDELEAAGIISAPDPNNGNRRKVL